MGYDLYVEQAEDESKDYFRANISGMDPIRQALEALGMGYWALNKESRFPDLPEGIDLSDEESPAYVAFKATEMAVRDREGSGKGIPLHKLCSNDGWLVTERECREALAAYSWPQLVKYVRKEYGEFGAHDTDAEWTRLSMGRFAKFLRRASTRGGFRTW